MSTFAKTAEFMSKYPVLSVIAVQKPEINTGMSRSSVQEVIIWIREFEITEQNFVCYSILSANRFCFLEIPEMREGIGLLQKCMQCKNVQMGLGKSKREWTALFYINWTNNLWKNENIYYYYCNSAVKVPTVLPACLAMAEVVLGGTTSKFSMGIFVWCNVSFATSWSEESRLDAPPLQSLCRKTWPNSLPQREQPHG